MLLSMQEHFSTPADYSLLFFNVIKIFSFEIGKTIKAICMRCMFLFHSDSLKIKKKWQIYYIYSLFQIKEVKKSFLFVMTGSPIRSLVHLFIFSHCIIYMNREWMEKRVKSNIWLVSISSKTKYNKKMQNSADALTWATICH